MAAVEAGSDKVSQTGEAIRALVAEVGKMGGRIAEISSASALNQSGS